MKLLSPRTFSVLLACFFSLQSAAESLMLGVHEGTSSSSDAIFMKAKYTPLADYLAAASGEKVVLETPKVLSIVARNLENKRYDVMLVRPSHLSARAMRDQGYRLLAVAAGEAKVHFIVRGDAKMKTLRDIKGLSIAMPDPLSYPTNLGLALMREEGINASQEKIQYMDRQDAVGLMVNSGMADVGVVMSYSKAGADWQKSGGRFLHSKGRLPYWSVIASPNVSQQTFERLQKALLALNNPGKSRNLLSNLDIAGFNEGKEQPYLNMLTWVEGKNIARLARNP